MEHTLIYGSWREQEHWWRKFENLRLKSRSTGKNRGEVQFLGMEKLQGNPLQGGSQPGSSLHYLPGFTPCSVEASWELGGYTWDGAGGLRATILITVTTEDHAHTYSFGTESSYNLK